MTTPNGPVLFNSSSGSDTDSSGLGPASAVTGYGAELDGTATIDVSMDGADLTTMSAGDLLFCSTSSGRQFSIIASVDTINETITTDDVWPTESGVAWAVGGKRATLQNSQHLWIKTDGAGGGLTYELETDQTMSSYVTSYSGMGGKIKSSVTGTKRVITIGGTYFASGGGWNCHDIHFKSSANLYLGRAGTDTQASAWYLYDCTVGDATDTFASLGTTQSRTLAVNANRTVFQNFLGVLWNGINANLNYCMVKDCDSAVFYASSLGSSSHFARHTVFTNCLYLSYQRRSQSTNICQCVIHGMTSTGYVMHYQDYGPGLITDNIWMDNAGDIEPYTSSRFFGNAYYNNTVNYPPSMESAAINLTADPFTDAAAGDFSLNSDAGGGATLRAASQTLGATTGYPFNWLTDGSGGGGGGSTVHPLYAN